MGSLKELNYSEMFQMVFKMLTWNASALVINLCTHCSNVEQNLS